MRIRGRIDGHMHSNLITHWSPDREPVLRLSDGQAATLLIPEASTDQINRKSKASDIAKLNHELTDAAVGPIFIEDAMPGDILRVDVLEIRCGRWGWSGIIPGFGLLSDLFPEPRLYHWSIRNGIVSPRGDEFLPGLRLHARPFIGIMGVAPAEKSSSYGMIPPQYFGGNMDNRRITEGSSVYFRVNVRGAGLCIADTHAIQGDGEVCGTAVETPSRTTVRVRVFSGKSLETPAVVHREGKRAANCFSTCGIAPDIMEASRKAVISMINFLSERGIDRYEAYVLCSVACDLSICEIVDAPNWNVACTIDMQLLKQLGVFI